MTQPNEQNNEPERLRKIRGFWGDSEHNIRMGQAKAKYSVIEEAKSDIAFLIEYLEYNQKMYVQVHDSRDGIEKELRRVEAERDMAVNIGIFSKAEIEILTDELAAKDKVLEWYADKENYTTSGRKIDPSNVMYDNGEAAIHVLLCYPPREKGADNG